jgi:hypothetical protein
MRRETGCVSRRVVKWRLQFTLEVPADPVVENLLGNEALGLAEGVEPVPADGDMADLLFIDELKDGGTPGVAGALEPSRHRRCHIKPTSFQHQRDHRETGKEIAARHCCGFP